MEEIVYLNGELLPRSRARISPFDLGFLYGYGLFETMRSYGGHIFRLERHLERLLQGAVELGMELDIPVSALAEACYEVLRANGLSDARVRLAVSAGEGDPGPGASPGRPTIFILARPYTPPSEEVYERGFRAVISGIRRVGPPLSCMKTANYLANLLARREATARGKDEALMLSEGGILAGASAGNVFLVFGGALHTPSLACGALPGIARMTVMELAARMNLEVKEREIAPEEIFRAEEAFLTNSLLEIMPLTEVEGKTIGESASGALSRRLAAAYKALVEEERQATP